MSHDKRHLRTLPDGRLAISSLSCEDNDPREVELCRKTQFEIGRQYLTEPTGEDAYRTITTLGTDWRAMVHFLDWVDWGESLPLDACHCIDVKDLPNDRATRNDWALKGRKVVINSERPPRTG